MLAAFHFNLAALSYVALLVGLFLVYNTVAIVGDLAARRDWRAQRAGHASSGVLLLFLGEAAALAALGCLAGIPLGWGLARGAVALTSATVTTLYVAHAAACRRSTGADAALAVGLGSAAVPGGGGRAGAGGGRRQPAAAVRGGTDDSSETPVPWRWTVGGVVVLAGIGGVQPGGAGRRACRSSASGGGVASCSGCRALVPAVLDGPGASTRWARASAGSGIEGGLRTPTSPARSVGSSVSVAALAVSLAMLVAIAVMIGSFRETVIYWVAQTLRADLYVATARRSNLDAQATISPLARAGHRRRSRR